MGGAFLPYFDVLFLGELRGATPDSKADDTVMVSWLLAEAVLRFKNGRPLVQDSGIELASPECRAVAAGIQGHFAEDARLFSLLEDDFEVEWSPWTAGRLGVIAGLLLVTKTTPQSPERARVIKEVVTCCRTLKQRHAGDHRDILWTDQFLLEDLSSFLFHEHLAASTPLDVKSLDADQQAFVEALWSIYGGHTYTLLYAGLLYPGIPAGDARMLSPVYDLA